MRRLHFVERKPIEVIMFIIAIGLLAYSLLVLSPFYVSDYGNAIAEGFASRGFEVGITLGFMASSIPGIIAPFNPKIPNIFMEWGSMGMFLSFLFLTILRVMLYGFMPLTWIHLLTLSLVCGAVRIYLRSHRT